MTQFLGEFGAAAAEAEGAEEKELRTFGIAGAIFYVDDDLSFIPYGKFCQAAMAGMTTAEVEGSAAIMEMLHDIVGADPGMEATEEQPGRQPNSKEEEWIRFCDHATTGKVKMDALLGICRAVLSGDAGRPTSPPSGSASGRSKTATSPKSNGRRSKSGSQQKPAKPANGFEPVTDDVIAGLRG